MSRINDFKSNRYQFNQRLVKQIDKNSSSIFDSHLTDQRIARDPWLLKRNADRVPSNPNASVASEMILGEDRADPFSGESRDVMGSPMSSPAQLFQSLLFDTQTNQSSGKQSDEQPKENSITEIELIHRAENAADPTLIDQTKVKPTAASFVRVEQLLQSTDNRSQSASEFEMSSPEYGKIRVAIEKAGHQWSLTLKSESLTQAEGLARFKKILETGLRQRLGVDLTIKII